MVSQAALVPGEAREVIRLRDKVDELQETVRQLKDLLAPPFAFPREWRLSNLETRVLAALLAAKGPYITRQALYVAMYDFETDAQEKTVDVYLCKVRKKLPWLKFANCWGSGFGLSAGTKELIRRALAGEPAPDALTGNEQLAGHDSLGLELERVKVVLDELRAENARLEAELAARDCTKPLEPTIQPAAIVPEDTAPALAGCTIRMIIALNASGLEPGEIARDTDTPLSEVKRVLAERRRA